MYKVKVLILFLNIFFLFGATNIHYASKVIRENVKEIINNSDNYDIYIVTGKLISKIPNTNKYIFSDGTAQIPVQIEDHMWQQIDSKYPQIDVFLSLLVIVNKETLDKPLLEAVRVRLSNKKNYNEALVR